MLSADGLLLEVLSSGAAVRRLDVRDGSGRTTNVVLGHADPQTYVADGGYLGATIGRFGNRIANGQFELDGRGYELDRNEGTSTLHGGTGGFDTRDWTVTALTSSSVRLELVSPDGDQGFPGRLAVAVTYTVTRDRVTIDYAATTDAPTVVNLTNHAYFNLMGEGTGSILDHRLVVEADAFTPIDARLVPTGEVRDVTGTPFDLRPAQRLGDVLASGRGDEQLDHGNGFDHNFVVRGSGLRRMATLAAPDGLTLEVASDQPGVQVYGGAHFDGTLVGPSGRTYQQHAGIALETQGFPDAPHHPGFPSTVLRPGEHLRSTTAWTFSRP